MSAAAGIALLTLIAQVESAGHTRVLLLSDCPQGLKGFYAPARNRIGLCRNTHNSDQELRGTLLHEAMHRLQHCHQPKLETSMSSPAVRAELEQKAAALQVWSDNDFANESQWLGRQLAASCRDQPAKSGN